MGPYFDGKYLLPDGSTRMSFAKGILCHEVLPTFDYASKITVRKFHSNDKDNHKLVIETIYDSSFDNEILTQIVDEIPDPIGTGGTPITDAITYSINALSKYSEADRKIILVTDGEETGKGDYNKAAKEAIELHGIPCNVFIIGIALTQEADIKAKGLAIATGGSYINLNAKNYDKNSLQNILRPLKNAAVSISIENNIRPISSSTPIIQSAISNITKPLQPVIVASQDSNIKSSDPSLVDDIAEIKPTDKLTEPVLIANNEEANTHNINSQKANEQIKAFSEQIEQNTTAIKLLSKQLVMVSEEIKNIKNTDDDIEPVINENSELNENVRLASESYLFEKLKHKFGNRLNWLNEQGEKGSSHDFEVLDTLDNSIEYYIECKGSMYAEKTFYLTKKEWSLFLANTKNYQIFFISNALSSPEITKIDNFMDWILRGKVVPFASKNIKLKAERIIFTIKG